MPEKELSRSFDLDSDVLIPGSTSRLTLSSMSPERFLEAVGNNRPFDADETYQIGKIDLLVGTEKGKPISFKAGKGSLEIDFTAAASVGLSIHNRTDDLLSALHLEDPGEIDPKFAGGQHYVLLRGAYNLKAHVEGTHPVGTVGALSFDVDGSRHKLFAIVHRVPEDTGALTALERTFKSVRFPRQVDKLADLEPGTCLITEANGSLDVNLSGQLGYNFSFIRELDGRLTGDIGLHVEAGLKIALGFHVSGRYLVLLDRESTDEKDSEVRLRLFKLKKHGWSFGLDLSVGVTPELEALPTKADDLVAATFGVHGRQVTEELNKARNWLDKLGEWSADDEALAEHAAGFLSDALADVVSEATGHDPRTALEDARERLEHFLNAENGFWQSLPVRVQEHLWKHLAQLGLEGKSREAFIESLELISSSNPQKRRNHVSELLTTGGFRTSPIGEWLEAAADRGLAALLENSDDLQPIAAKTLEVVNGEFIEGIQKVVEERLNLDRLREKLDEIDYEKVDEWLKRRLARFIGKLDLPFEEFQKVREAVGAVIERREEIYQTAVKALEKKREFSFAYAYHSATEKTALLDAVFDLDEAPARTLLREVLDESNYDRILTDEVKGVELQKGVLSHALERGSSVEITMPFYDSKKSTLTKSLAKVEAVTEGDRVLFYELDASNTVEVNDRIRGRLSVAAAITVPMGDGVRVFSKEHGGLSYEYRAAYESLNTARFEREVGPFLTKYFPAHFPDHQSMRTWIGEVDRRSDVATGTPPDILGDSLIALDVSLPAEAIKAWLTPRNSSELRDVSLRLSKALQATLKRIIPGYYFQDAVKYKNLGASAPLLLWAAVPPSVEIKLVRGDPVPKSNPDIYWDYLNRKKMEAMVFHPVTQARLMVSMNKAARVLEEIGSSQAEDYRWSETTRDNLMQKADWDSPGFAGLFRFEKRVVKGARDALKKAERFISNKKVEPEEAVKALAEFGAEITETFNSDLKSRYGTAPLRSLGMMVFLESLKSLNSEFGVIQPTALLSFDVLVNDHGLKLVNLREGGTPDAKLLAVCESFASK